MSNITLFGAADEGRDVARLTRATMKNIDRVHGHALIAAAKAEGAAYVTGVALQHIGILSMQEALLVEEVPHAAGRAKAVVDSYTVAAVGIIHELGQ